MDKVKGQVFAHYDREQPSSNQSYLEGAKTRPAPSYSNSEIQVERRKDNGLRETIAKIQHAIQNGNEPEKIFTLLLRQVAILCSANYGAIFISNDDTYNSIFPLKKNGLKKVTLDHSDKFISIDRVTTWLLKSSLQEKPRTIDAPFSETDGLLFEENRIASSVLILPILVLGNVKAICFLGLKTGSFEEHVIRRIAPLVGSVVFSIQSSRYLRKADVSLENKIFRDKFLSSLMSTSPVSILAIGEHKEVIYCNPAAHLMFFDKVVDVANVQSVDVGDFKEKNVYEFMPNYDDLILTYSERQVLSQTPGKSEPIWLKSQQAFAAQNKTIYVDVGVFRQTVGLKNCTVLQLLDVTSQQQVSEAYQLANQQLSALTNLAPVGIIRVDCNWDCVYVNDKWLDLTGLTKEESLETHWINAINVQDVQKVLEDLRDSLQNGENYHSEIKITTPEGVQRWVDCSTQILFDDAGEVQGFLGTFADITERLLNEEKLRHVAEYDELTGLANRYLFQDNLQNAFSLASANNDTLTLFFLDLDGFKHVNDSQGHDAGDELLKQVSARLINALRHEDIVARFGGDEFVVLLDIDRLNTETVPLANDIIAAIGEPYLINDKKTYVTVSVGISRANADTSSPEQLLKEADAALYLAKDNGKNTYRQFDSAIDKLVRVKVDLTNQLRTASVDKRFFLTYQMQLDINTGDVIGLEALLRFKNNRNETVSPIDFIPILEESGMIIEVGNWVIEKSCHQYNLWRAQGRLPENSFLSINVSPKQLLCSTFLRVIKNASEVHKISPENIVIELTESVIIDRPEQVKLVLDELTSLGFKLALDDFGTGYSSLSYLQKYPFNHIKIDKSFISDLAKDSNDAKIINSIIALANSLDLEVTAEGVENAHTLGLLKHFGANYYQGFYHSQPMTAQEIENFIK